MIKKLLLSAAIVTGATAGAFAQQYISLGPVVGIGQSFVTNDVYMDQVVIERDLFKVGLKAGLAVMYSRKEHWGVGGEVLYSKIGYKKWYVTYVDSLTGAPVQSYNETNDAGYVQVPLRFYYFPGKYNTKARAKAYIGPVFGFNLMEVQHRKALDGTLPPDLEDMPRYNSFDFGLQAGIGVNVYLAKSLWLNLDLNYYQGLTDALTDDRIRTGTNLNEHFGIQVGLLFGLGKQAAAKKE
jgi:hypothetical protein